MRIKQINPRGWYDIPGYDGKYQINYFGNVRRALKRGYKALHPYIKTTNGRRVVKLNCKEQVIMKLMQITFIGELPPGMVTYHKNGIITDDALNNIGIITRSTDTLAQYANDIEQYTQLAEAAASGNADAIEAAVNKITAGVKTANNATSEELQKQVVEVSKTEDLIRQEVKNKTPGFTEEMQKQASEATKAALEEFAKAAPKSADELKKVPPAAIAALIAGDMKGQLSSEAKGAVDGILDQFDGLDKKTKKKFANAVYGALEGLEGFDELKDPAKEGVDEFLESLRSALDEHSPSKKTEEIFELAMDGAANGVEAGKENVLTKAGEFVSAFLNVFTSGDVGKQLENLGNKVMSYFGIGVSSKTKDSASAGKANADAANKGAGSVSPTATGQGFGTKFASGISDIVGKARTAGKGNADAANKGAGSVNPSGTGGKFGSQYSSGVSGKQNRQIPAEDL